VINALIFKVCHGFHDKIANIVDGPLLQIEKDVSFQIIDLSMAVSVATHFLHLQND
jgi:hypothetical protein